MSLSSAVIVGIGGVGKSILLRIRRMIVEEYGSLENVPSVRFLQLDTFDNFAPESDQMIPSEILGQSILFEPQEQLLLSRNIPNIIYDDGSNPIFDWIDRELPLNNLSANLRGQGAGAVRAYGRLAFHYNIGQYRSAIVRLAAEAQDAINRSRSSQTLGETVEPDLDVYVVCSFFGGTGSGVFLDLCYATREYLRDFKLKVNGFFVIGALNPNPVMKANCYAALKELNYFTSLSFDATLPAYRVRFPVLGVSEIVSNQPPVDNCYLLGSTNGSGVNFSRNDFEEKVARCLFLEFTRGITTEMRGKRVDIKNAVYAFHAPDAMGYGQGFLSRGLAIMEYPAVLVQDLLSAKLAADFCDYALYSAAPGYDNLTRVVNTFLENCHLSESELHRHFLGNLENEILKEIKHRKESLDREVEAKEFDQGSILAALRNSIQHLKLLVKNDPNPADRGAYLTTIFTRMENFRDELVKQIEQRIINDVNNEYIGPVHCLNFINALIQNLKNQEDRFSRQRQNFGKMALEEERKVDDLCERFHRDIHPGNRLFLREYSRILHLEELPRYARITLRQAACTAVLQLLKEVTGVLEKLREEVQKYQNTLNAWEEEFKWYFAEKKDLLLQSEWVRKFLLDDLNVQDGDQERRILEHLERKEKEIIPARSSILQQIMGVLVSRLGENFFVAVIHGPSNVRRELRQECSRRLEMVKHSSVVTDIVRHNVSTVVNTKLTEAGILLNLQHLNSGTGHIAELCYRKWVAVHKDGASDPHVAELRKHLPADYVMTYCLEEPYRVIFAEELGVYPLRCINFIGDYKRAYDGFGLVDRKRRDTDTRYVFRDLVPPHPLLPRLYERSEKIVPLARFFDILHEEEGPDGKAIFLTTCDQGTGIPLVTRIADCWEEVPERLVQQQIEKDIEGQFTGATNLEKIEREVEKAFLGIKTRDQRQSVLEKVRHYLVALSQSLEGGETHFRYRQEAAVFNEYLKRYEIIWDGA